MTIPFNGYDGQVWAVVYASFQYFIQKLETTSNPGTAVPLAQVVYDTTINALEAVNINRIVQNWTSEYELLLEVEALPITIDPQQAAYFINRTAALALAIPALRQLIPLISLNAVGPVLDQDKTPIPDPNFLLWLNNFLYETPSTTLGEANLIEESQNVVDAFNVVAAQTKILQGSFLSSLYDVSIRYATVAQVITNILENLTSGNIVVSSSGSSVVIGTESGGVLGTNSGQVIGSESGVSGGLSAKAIWNQVVASPALLLDAALVNSAPYTIQTQQDMVIRYLILSMQNQLATFLLTMRRPLTATINQALLLTGNSLLDVAAKNTGNFENWTSIATANGLLPPYVGAKSGPGIAGWGSQLILPNPGTATSSTGAIPSYNTNYLGVDEYIGPINGFMPTWTGDYEYIFGLENLRWALGRRVQTSLGSMIYHSTYGCRIPPEVGNIQDTNTVGRIAAFGKAALQQDPRVKNVLSAVAQSLPNFAVAFQAIIQPGGFGSSSLSVNEVISPSTAPLVDAT